MNRARIFRPSCRFFQSKVAAATALAMLGICPLQAFANIISVSGIYNGTINGVAIAATSVGTLDTTGTGNNEVSVNFSSIPNSTFTPLAIHASLLSILCGNGLVANPSALNLFDLTGGNYSVTRHYSWSSLPGSGLDVIANVSTVGANMTYIMSMNGTYSGPTQISGLSSYGMDWSPSPLLTMFEHGTARLVSAQGDFDMDFDSMYSGLLQPLPSTQRSRITPLDLTYIPTGATAGNSHVQWIGTVSAVPEPSSLMLVCLAIYGVAASMLKHRGALNQIQSDIPAIGVA